MLGNFGYIRTTKGRGYAGMNKTKTTIKKRISLLLVGLLAMFAVFLFTLIFSLGGYNKQMKFYTQNYYYIAKNVDSANTLRNALDSYVVVGGDDKAKAEKLKNSFDEFRDDVKQLYAVRFKLGGDLRPSVEEINGKLSPISTSVSSVLQYSCSDAGESVHTASLRENLDYVTEKLNLIFESIAKTGIEKHDSFKGGVVFVQVLMVLSFIGMVFMIISTVYFIKNRIEKPINDTCEWAAMFKEDYCDMSDLKFDNGDEMSQLAESFNTVKETLAKANAMKAEYETLMQKIHNDEEHKKKFVQQLYDEKREKEAISTVAKHDGLTGLYNRRTFDGIVDDFMAKKPKGTEGALFLIDMDNFKNVNDTLGHLAGDEALKTLAGTMRIVFNGSYLGRYGGDEFIVFVADYKTEDELVRLASDLCTKMDKVFESDGKSVKLSVSVGVATTDGMDEYSELYMKADKALYFSKENGRNQYKMASTL